MVGDDAIILEAEGLRFSRSQQPIEIILFRPSPAGGLLGNLLQGFDCRLSFLFSSGRAGLDAPASFQVLQQSGKGERIEDAIGRYAAFARHLDAPARQI